MKKQVELLAPGGDTESIRAAIAAGADAVYCGLHRFNARNRAANLSFSELGDMLGLAHGNGCKIYLVLNIIIVETELPALVDTLNKVVGLGIDGIIVQDIGLLYLLKDAFPTVSVHASTQLTTHNSSQIRFLKKLNVARINLCRELSVDEITKLTSASHEVGIESEVFVHGSHCLSFSGICYMSSVVCGTSGNRGRCSQPCRNSYKKTEMGKDYPLNLKDISLFSDIADLVDTGVDSLKIEGRIKKFHYVYTVVREWRKQLQKLHENCLTVSDDSVLRSVFNRDFSNGFFKGRISSHVFIDDCRDNSALYLLKSMEGVGKSDEHGADALHNAKKARYDERTEIIRRAKEEIDALRLVRHSGKDSVPGSCNSYVTIPKIRKPERQIISSRLSVLVSSIDDFYLSDQKNPRINFFFKLPDSYECLYGEIVAKLREYPEIIPWFPPVVLEDNLASAVKLLKELKPERIVTENSGVGYEAYRLGISWIAGPQLNLVNSFSLQCLKEEFYCVGAFISNELKKNQIKLICIPDDFELHYTIFQPLLLMTSRQCMFPQIDGCVKECVDSECLEQCQRRGGIESDTDKRDGSVIIEKSRGNHQRLYHNVHQLNTEIVNDIKDMFSSFVVDLSDVQTETHILPDKTALISLFDDLLCGRVFATQNLKDKIYPVTNCQYQRGL